MSEKQILTLDSQILKREKLKALGKNTLLRQLIISSQIDYETGCFLVKGRNNKDYGTVSFNLGKGISRTVKAHRLAAHIFHNMPLESNLDVAHKLHCPNKNCWSPSHIYLATTSQNVLDSVKSGTHRNSRKTHCYEGHEFTPENTIHYEGTRRCKICNDARNLTRRKS